jgi:hypothetical protein
VGVAAVLVIRRGAGALPPRREADLGSKLLAITFLVRYAFETGVGARLVVGVAFIIRARPGGVVVLGIVRITIALMPGYVSDFVTQLPFHPAFNGASGSTLGSGHHRLD